MLYALWLPSNREGVWSMGVVVLIGGHLILQVPDSIFMSDLLVHHTTFGKDTYLKSSHVEQKVRIVFTVH